MTNAATIRIIDNPTPLRLGMLKRHLTAPRPDAKVLRNIYQYTHIIHNSYDPQFNLVVFLACGLALYSPLALVEDTATRRGVCKAMAQVAGVGQDDASYYIRRYARHYYEKRKGFADLVESIVERLG